MTGNNNDVSVQSFLASVFGHLDTHVRDWRQTHMLMLDNCPSHKTKGTVELLERHRVPTTFTAPASYLAVPAEQIFKKIKCLDLDLHAEPDKDKLGDLNIRKLTVKQTVMLKITNYLFKIGIGEVKDMFAVRLKNLK